MYLWLKLIHVAAVVVFLGNIITGLFWHAHAARTRDPNLLAFTMGGILRSDRLFTVPMVFLIIVSGVGAALHNHYPLWGTFWIRWGLILFAVSGLLFMTRVAPLQRRLHALALAGAQGGGFDYRKYASLARQWEIWGGLALVTPLLAVAFMVLKPTG
jgi:uncharacterized membrane protein